MQIVALLSDLKSLSVCPHEAALNLVNTAKSVDANSNDATSKNDSITTQKSQADEEDPDLKRANEIVSLHYDVKAKHLESGLDFEIIQARRDVQKVLAALRSTN